jgi:hypothetical protein
MKFKQLNTSQDMLSLNPLPTPLSFKKIADTMDEGDVMSFRYNSTDYEMEIFLVSSNKKYMHVKTLHKINSLRGTMNVGDISKTYIKMFTHNMMGIKSKAKIPVGEITDVTITIRNLRW